MSANVDDEYNDNSATDQHDDATNRLTTKTTKKKAKKPLNKSARAGLVFPVSKTNGRMKDRRNPRDKLGGNSPVFLAAVMEYICREILEKASESTTARKRKTITVQDVTNAIRNDTALHRCYTWVRVYNPLPVKFNAKKQAKTAPKPAEINA